MQLSRFVIALFAFSACQNVAADDVADHPIGKVITLLQDLMDKVKSEGKNEEVSYQKFVYWCKTSSAELAKAIQGEKDTIDTLESTIEAKTKEIELLTDDIGKLESEIGDLQAADKEAIEDDKDRNKLYTEKEADLKSTISSIDEAIKALVAAGESTDSKLFLSQHRLAKNRVRDIFALIATVANEGQQQSLMNFVQSDEDPKVLAGGDLTKHTKKYSFKSDSVTELLKNLKLKFEDELLEATKAETNAANAFALSKKARDAALKATEDSKKQKETDKSDAEGALATAKGDLKDTQDDLKADSEAFDSTKDSCSMKKSEWDERSAIRQQELEAMTAAIKILSKVSGVRTEAPSNPVPPSAPVSLLQIASDPQSKAVRLLRATAKTFHSKALERLAMEVETHVPKAFQDVINQIQKMIFRLKQEQTDEDNHKAWCDMELSKTNTSIDTKTDKIKELDAKLKEDNAMVVTLTEEITEAQKMVADIKVFQEEATEIRTTGKEENKLAIKDAVAAQKAITNAISVLQTFYKSSGEIAKEPWEFLQEPVKLPEDPKTWDSGYTGVNDPKEAGKGVIAVLEATSSDFAKMEANTRAQEVADQKEYDDSMKKHAIELSRRQKESDMKGEQKKRLIGKITDTTAQRKHVSDEMESTEQYYKDLMPACLDGDSTYGARKAARDAEIAALGQAQGILDNAFSGAPAPAPQEAMFLHRRIERHH